VWAECENDLKIWMRLHVACWLLLLAASCGSALGPPSTPKKVSLR
jgi:hypothetical protein